MCFLFTNVISKSGMDDNVFFLSFIMHMGFFTKTNPTTNSENKAYYAAEQQ